ncbi:MAG: TonB-dependent receptor [Bacteroidales bacterium]|nr:TonB-dependent receptor [Bacteroidales bacterium]
MKKYFIFIIIIIFSGHLIKAQNLIIGKITDEDFEQLVGANIYIPELNKGTVADNNGKYVLSDIPDGKIKIQFSFIGHTNEIRTVIFNGSPVEMNITLSTTAIETKEIVVSGGYNATQHENAVNIDILKLKSPTNIISPNFTEMLTKVPGVDMISKGSGISKPVIRGLSMDNVLVLNNGVRNENYQYSDHHPLGIDEFGIEDVEIIKGPASLLYGSDAIGGVMNFIKEKPAPVGQIIGDYHLQLFSNTLGLSTNLGMKGASKKFFGGIRLGTKSNTDFLQGGGDFVPNSRFSTMSIKANGGFTGKSAVSKINYEFSRQKLGLTEEEAVEAITSRERKNEIWYQQFNNHLLSSQNKIFLNNFKIEINAAFQSAGLMHYAGIDTTEIAMRLSTLTYETKLYLPSKEKSEYIIGFQGFNQFNLNIRDAEEILLPDAQTDNYSVFSLLQFHLFDEFKMQTGLRYDHKFINTSEVGSPIDYNYRSPLKLDYGSFSGSVGATYEFADKLFFRGNFAAAYRTPNLAELTSNGKHETRYEIGNSILVPQKAYETDVSIHYHTENLTFDLAGFYNIIDDYIFISPTNDTTPDGDHIYRYNQTNATLFGGEAGIHIHPEKFRWIHFEATFSKVTGKQGNGDYLPFIPANKLNFELKLEKEKLGILQDAFFKVNSSSAFNQNHPAPDEMRTDGYTLFDISLGTKIKIGQQALSAEISVNNIFDKKYIDHLSTLNEVNYFDPGRNVAISFTIPFAIK